MSVREAGKCKPYHSVRPIRLTVYSRFLQATVGGLASSQPPAVRISAVRAVYGFCEHLKSNNSTAVLQPYIQAMLEGLLAVAQQFSCEVLALCLETLYIILGVRYSISYRYQFWWSVMTRINWW